MKTFKTLLLASTAAAFCATIGAPEANAKGFYLGADAGIAFPSFSKIKGDTGKLKFKLKDGFVGDIVVGYGFNNNLRAELDFGYRKYDLKSIGGFDIKGSVESYAVTANLLYDFVNSTKFTPFVGVGAGIAHNKKKDKTIGIDGSATRFAALGTVGVSYNFTDSFSASLAYRLFASWDQKAGNGSNYDMYSNEILLGLRYDFGAPKKVASSSYTEQYTTVYDDTAAAELPEYMVFFALNSAVITPEAKITLQKVASEYKENGNAKLKLTGHTDLTGPAAFNMALSKERAAAAKKVLVSMGVPASVITTKGVGMADPLIPTALGVPEPQNRRVVMDFD